MSERQIGVRMKQYANIEQHKILSRPIERTQFGNTTKMLTKARFGLVHPYLGRLLGGVRNMSSLPPNSPLYKVLSIPENLKVFNQSLPDRDIELCVIVMGELTAAQINEHLQRMKAQTYSKWRLAVPVSPSEAVREMDD